MASTTKSGAFGKRGGNGNFDILGAGQFLSSVVSGIFSSITNGITTETAGDISLYQQQTDDLKTKRTQNVVIAIVVAAIAAATAFLLLRKK